ncbi:MAG: hypothetical protein IPK24_07045 [Kineosporiaceae bacterium]|nr:hypothetical protein [Kineosporiaceae bacterium]
MARSRRGPTRSVPLALALGAGVAGLALGMPSAAAATVDVVLLRFDGGAVGTEITSVVNEGASAATTTATVVKDTARAGRAITVASYAGSGTAADFPAFSTSGARAIMAIRPASGQPDTLNPGTARLEFGADIVLDSGTTAVSGSKDDGNNVVQRGLYNDKAQFKLEIDSGKPRCRVKGSGGAVEFSSSVKVTAGKRYRLKCLRPAGSNTVTLTVAPIAADGTVGAATSTSRTASAIGSLNYSATVPFTVGGKLSASLSLATPSSDQFNGVIDNVVLRLG